MVAKITGRSETSVYRWTYPKSKGGSGGIIPSEMQNKLLRGAQAEGIKLTPEDFFNIAEETPEKGSAA